VAILTCYGVSPLPPALMPDNFSHNMQIPPDLLKKYDPVGRCIYCGAEPGLDALSDEHIIPEGLGGSATAT
jgi:hypothetical protein